MARLRRPPEPPAKRWNVPSRLKGPIVVEDWVKPRDFADWEPNERINRSAAEQLAEAVAIRASRLRSRARWAWLEAHDVPTLEQCKVIPTRGPARFRDLDPYLDAAGIAP